MIGVIIFVAAAVKKGTLFFCMSMQINHAKYSMARILEDLNIFFYTKNLWMQNL